MFTRDDLRTLIDETARPAVSIFLPTHIRGREVRQDPIRLRNLLGEAEEKLVGRGMRAEDARDLLVPARDRVDDELFWRHQDKGLALFVAPGVYHCHKVAVQPPEQVVVGPVFQVKPLLGLVATDGRFYLLAISANRVRLFEGSRFGFAERTDIGFPEGVAAIAEETEYENMRHASPVARTRAGTPGGIAKTQNFGEDPEELRKTEQIEYLRRVAAALEEKLDGDPTPIIIAADAQNRGHFLKLAKLKSIVPDALEINPDAFEPDALQRMALERAEPLLLEARRRALDQFNVLLGNNDPRASLKVEEIVKAARYGRVEMLFAAEGENLWGRFDEKTDEVTAQGQPDGDNMELLDYAAAQTLLQGGRVDLLPKAEMPRNALLAAILRY